MQEKRKSKGVASVLRKNSIMERGEQSDKEKGYTDGTMEEEDGAF